MNKQEIPAQDAIGTDHMSPCHGEQEEASYDPTRLVCDQQAAQGTTSPFMKTPLEIRNQIYEYLLSTKRTKVDFHNDSPEFVPYWPSHPRRVYYFHPAILIANRQINHEAGHILRENLFVKLMTNAPQYGIGLISRGLPVVAEADSASRVTYFATEITLILGTQTLDRHSSILLFAGDDMNLFCRMLLRSKLSCYNQSSLSIAVRGVALTRTRILKLLEPFRRLHSMASVSITGQIEGEYKSDLIAKISKQAPGNDTVVQEIQNAVEEGDQAVSIHDFSTAISRFKRAWEDNKDWDWTYHRTEAILTSGNFDGNPFNTTFVQTGLVLNTKLAITYLKLENHSLAYEWIKPALARIGPYRQVLGALLGGAACASIYTIAALASEGLGLVERAVEEMREAVRHDPGDSKLATELMRLERKMQIRDEDSEVLEGGLGVACKGQCSKLSVNYAEFGTVAAL